MTKRAVGGYNRFAPKGGLGSGRDWIRRGVGDRRGQNRSMSVASGEKKRGSAGQVKILS